MKERKGTMSGDVIEFPQSRERALERLNETLSNPHIPMEQLWTACRVVESLLHLDERKARTIEELADMAAKGVCLHVSYSGSTSGY